jgi:hypothetical protein
MSDKQEHRARSLGAQDRWRARSPARTGRRAGIREVS